MIWTSPGQMPDYLGVWGGPPSSDRSGGTVAECCTRSKTGVGEAEYRGGKVEGEKLAISLAHSGPLL